MKYKKVLYDKIDNKKWYIDELSRDFTCSYGFISKEDLTKTGIVKTNTDREMYLWDASFFDNFSKLKRGPALVIAKDIAGIIAHTMPDQKSLIVDGGAGTGALACALAHLFPKSKIISYDDRESHLKIAKTNAENLDLTNVEFKLGNLKTDIKENKINLLTLDMPVPWEVLESVIDKINQGGFIVSYLPCITQVQKLIEELDNYDCYVHDRSIELIQRDWDVDGKKVRPKAGNLSHTAFLVFIRKIV